MYKLSYTLIELLNIRITCGSTLTRLRERKKVQKKVRCSSPRDLLTLYSRRVVGKTTIDQGAANRFIKHAITQANLQRPPGDAEAGPSKADVRVPVKVTSKTEARAQYEKDLKELGEEERDDKRYRDGEASEESRRNWAEIGGCR